MSALQALIYPLPLLVATALVALAARDWRTLGGQTEAAWATQPQRSVASA